MSADCIFCKIAKGEIPTTKVFENEKVLAFKDLRPQASQHYLFIHKVHTKDLNDMMATHPNQAADILGAISDFSRQEHLLKNGYRVVNNIGPHAGQTVFHTHFHVLAGEPLGHFGS
jgi:histidine triad (HIT) family protein